MPTHDVAKARLWRERHLDPARVKGMRADTLTTVASSRPAPPINRPADDNGDQALQDLEELATIAGALLAAGRFAEIEPELRAALRAVPPHRRDDVAIDLASAAPTDDDEPYAASIPVAVFERLIAPVMAAVRQLEREDPPTEPREAMSDAVAQEMGEFWYQVAAGMWRVTNPAPSSAPGG
jgi:hypothetical protein